MSIKILLADDHRVFIEGMRSLLKEVNGFEVVGEAENGKILVEKALALKPDVVLTDVQMPEMDGIEATRLIKKQWPEVKIIVLTMLNESMFIKKMLEAGASGYLIKTVDKDELINAIKKVATGEKYFAADVTSKLMNDFSAKPSTSTLDSLTKREKEILVLIAQGLTDKEIAEKVFLSALTVTTHRKNILSKLGLKNKVELTRFAMEHKLQ
jgi:DNA-binding NarL/FixJ family response regulator